MTNMVRHYHIPPCIARVELYAAIQGLRCSTHVKRYLVHARSQVGSLHEDPPSYDFLGYASKFRFYVSVRSDLKILAQFLAVLVTAPLKVGFRHLLFERFPDICTPDQPQRLVCPHAPVFFTSSVIWGLVGPVRQFGSGAIYHPMLYAMIFGALIPVPFWLWIRRRPKSLASKIFTPAWFANSFNSPPVTGINVSSSFVVGFIFQYIIRKKNFLWWAKFNYVTSAGLDAGTGFAIVVMFFAFAVSAFLPFFCYIIYQRGV
jgi:hypothetical protein